MSKNRRFKYPRASLTGGATASGQGLTNQTSLGEPKPNKLAGHVNNSASEPSCQVSEPIKSNGITQPKAHDSLTGDSNDVHGVNYVSVGKAKWSKSAGRTRNYIHNQRTHNNRKKKNEIAQVEPKVTVLQKPITASSVIVDNVFDVLVDESIQNIREEVSKGKSLVQVVKSERKKRSVAGKDKPIDMPENDIFNIGVVRQTNNSYENKRPEESEENDIFNIRVVGQTNNSYNEKPEPTVENNIFNIGVVVQTNNCYSERIVPNIEYSNLTQIYKEVEEVCKYRQVKEKLKPVTRSFMGREPTPCGKIKFKDPGFLKGTLWKGIKEILPEKKEQSIVPDPNVIVVKPAWYHRKIPGFKKDPSKFDFEKPINHQIDRVVKEKIVEEGKSSGVLVADDLIIDDLFYYLRLHQHVVYPSRELKIEHLHKLALKWLEIENLSIKTPILTNKFLVTIQKATDQNDNAALYCKEAQEISRSKKNFLKAHFSGSSKTTRYQ